MSAVKSANTRRKVAAKKPVAKPAAKKTTAKRAPAKKTTSAARSKAGQQAAQRSFRLQNETEPFLTTRVNRQTAYWLVLGVLAIAFTLWVAHLNSQIQELYDIVDRNVATSSQLEARQIDLLRAKK